MRRFSPFGVNPPDSETKTNSGVWRDILAFWFLGFFYNLDYWVILNINYHQYFKLTRKNDTEEYNLDNTDNVVNISLSDEPPRDCSFIWPSSFLYADILSMFMTKLLLPFIPLCENLVVGVNCILSIVGCMLGSYRDHPWLPIVGFCCSATGTALAEPILLAYATYYNKNVISAFASGTGVASLVGILLLVAIRNFIKYDGIIIQSMAISPILKAGVFWVLLRKPIDATNLTPEEFEKVYTPKKMSVCDKIRFFRHIYSYILPMVVLSFCLFVIKNGVMSLIHFKESSFTQPEQTMIIVYAFMVASALAKSSVNIIRFEKIWLLASFQFINAIYFAIEAKVLFLPSLYIAVGLAFWSGILSGASYVNTYYKMANEMRPNYRLIAVRFVSQSDTIGFILAIPITVAGHNWICSLKGTERKFYYF